MGTQDLSLPPKIGLGLEKLIDCVAKGEVIQNSLDVVDTLRILESVWGTAFSSEYIQS